MSSTPATHAPAVSSADEFAGPVLDVEKLDVYRVALEFHVASGDLVPRCERVLYDQFQRPGHAPLASTRVYLGINVGASRG